MNSGRRSPLRPWQGHHRAFRLRRKMRVRPPALWREHRPGLLREFPLRPCRRQVPRMRCPRPVRPTRCSGQRNRPRLRSRPAEWGRDRPLEFPPGRVRFLRSCVFTPFSRGGGEILFTSRFRGLHRGLLLLQSGEPLEARLGCRGKRAEVLLHALRHHKPSPANGEPSWPPLR